MTQEFKDHIVQHPNRFKRVPVAGTTDQFDMIPTWVENPSEVVQLGTPIDRQLFEGITSRLADIETQTNEELGLVDGRLTDAETAIMFTGGEYGRFEELPSDFPATLPFTLYRDLTDGQVKHDVNFDEFEVGAGNVFVDGYAGNDANDGLTTGTPVQSVNRALTVANGLANPTVIVNFKNETYDETRFLSVFDLAVTKNIVFKSISPSGKTLIHSGQRYTSVSWTADGTAFKTTRSATSDVLDWKYKDEDGKVVELVAKTSVSEVQNTPGSWYTDGTTVWVRLQDSRTPDSLVVMMLPKDFRIRVNLSSGVRFVMRDIDVYFETTLDDAFEIRTPNTRNNGSEVWAKNCVFSRSKASNGFGTVGVNYTYLFDCISHKNKSDGFNYHCFGIYPENNEFVFEYHCKGYNNGDATTGTSNATTAHDGLNVLRIGSVGRDSYGPILADVNGCYSVNIDCDMSDSLKAAGDTKSGYYFDNASAVKQGKAVLINCKGGGTNTYSINSDKTIPILLRRFTGRNVPAGNLLKPY